jgi:hypothetical protein
MLLPPYEPSDETDEDDGDQESYGTQSKQKVESEGNEECKDDSSEDEG